MGLILRLAWRNIFRNKRRTALTLAAAVFAVVLLVHMIALTTGVHERMIEDNVRMHAGHLQLTGAGYLEDRTLERFVEWTPQLAAAIDGTRGVAAAAPRVNGFALLSNGPASQGTLLLGVDPDREALVSTWPQRVVSGAFLGGAPTREILLGERLAETLGVELGDEVLVYTVAYTLENAYELFRVRGLIRAPDPRLERSLALISLADAQALFAYEARVSEVAMLARDASRLDETRAELLARLRPLERRAVDVNPWPVVMPELAQLIRIDDIQNYSMLAILVVVVAFGILNTILMSVLERQRELGVMLALGLAPRGIFRLVYVESLLLSGLGLALGLALAVPAALYMQGHPIPITGDIQSLTEMFGAAPVVTWRLSAWNPALATLLMIAIATLAALYPAAKAASARPVDALRSL
ncbi:MAG TPA: FtsX-like permease family protein [Myxococcota bacterium]|nr:FtsX-like permease family protein [Myxococcota bacterium]